MLTDVETRFLQASRDFAARELERVRRTNRRLRQLLGLGMVLLVLAVVASGIAVFKADEARTSAALANEQTLIAKTQQLMSDAAGLRPTQPDLSLLLGAEAVRRSPPALRTDAVVGLRQTMNRTFHLAEVLPHPDTVNAVDFSRDGTIVATAGKDGAVRIWDTTTGQQVGEPFLRHGANVRGVAVSPEDDQGSVVASTSDGGTVWIWKRRTGESFRLAQGLGAVGDIAFDQDGSAVVVSTDDGKLIRYALDGSPRELLIPGAGASLWRIAFNPDFDVVAAACEDGTIRRVDLRTGRELPPIRGHEGWVNGVAYSNNGKLLVSAGEDGTVRVWDPGSGRALRRMQGSSGELTDVAIAPDDHLVAASGRDGRIQLWNASTGRATGQLAGHANAVRGLAFSGQGRLASGSFDRSARLWDLAPTRPGAALIQAEKVPGADPRVNAVAYSPDGRQLVTAGADGTARLWDATTGKHLRTFGIGRDPSNPGAYVWVADVAFSPNGRRIATASADGLVRLWDVAQGVQLGAALPVGSGEATSVAFSPDGTRLAAGDKGTGGRPGTVIVWRVADRTREADMCPRVGDDCAVRSSQVTDLVFVDNEVVAATSAAGTVRRWDFLSGDLRTTAVPHSGWALGIATDGRSSTVASAGGDGVVKIWSGSDLTPGAALEGMVAEVDAVAFDRTGSLLASVGKDGAQRLWNVATGRLVGEPLSTGSTEVTAVAFSPTGPQDAMAGPDGQVWVTSFDPVLTRREACAVANRELSDEEWLRYVGTPHDGPKVSCLG